MPKEDCFILCTGPSLLNLTDKEKDHIRSCPNVCVNRYPVFWKQIGIKPTDYILLDTHKVDTLVQGIVDNNEELNIITCVENKSIFKSLINIHKPHFRARYTIFNKDRNRSKFIDNIDSSLSLFWSSILGSAVNFYAILYPDKNIKILGMDGGSSSHFWTNFTNDKLDHSSPNQKHNSLNMLKWGLPIINSECKKRSISVYSCSENSFWNQNGYIEYSTVIS